MTAIAGQTEVPINLHEYEAAARELLSPMVHGYIAGGSDDEVTLRANRAASTARATPAAVPSAPKTHPVNPAAAATIPSPPSAAEKSAASHPERVPLTSPSDHIR